jgi:hypothetical protein
VSDDAVKKEGIEDIVIEVDNDYLRKLIAEKPLASDEKTSQIAFNRFGRKFNRFGRAFNRFGR